MKAFVLLALLNLNGDVYHQPVKFYDNIEQCHAKAAMYDQSQVNTMRSTWKWTVKCLQFSPEEVVDSEGCQQ